MEISDSLRAFVEEKSARLQRHFSKLDKVQVVLSRLHNQNERYEAEFTIHAPRNTHMVATCIDSDLRRAIDTSLDRIERQLVRFKEKLQEKRQKGTE